MTSAHGFPIFLGKPAGLYDPIENPGAERWFPCSEPAALLVVAVQACKDIVRIGRSLSQPRPSADRRGMTLLSVPILSLVENTVRLQKLLGKEDRSDWPPPDPEKFIKLGKKLRKLADGPLRTLRSRRAAHHDASALGLKGAPDAKPELVLPPLGVALVVLTLAFNHNRVFEWTRYPDPGEPNDVEFFIEIAARARTDDDGRIKQLISVEVTDDPRLEAFKPVEEARDLYNRLILDAGYPSQRIAFTPRDRLERA